MTGNDDDTDTAAQHDVAGAEPPGIPAGKVALLNGYDRGYPEDGVATPIDPAARPVLRDALPAVAPRFDAQGAMEFTAGTWKIKVPGALGGMLFPRQAPLQAVGLDPAVRYQASGAIDSDVNPPVMDVQMIENPPPRRRQWIIE